jgi:hypothetical protein
MRAIPMIERKGPVDIVADRPKDFINEDVRPICRMKISRPETEFKAPTYTPLSEADLIRVAKSVVLIKYVVALIDEPRRIEAAFKLRNLEETISLTD